MGTFIQDFEGFAPGTTLATGAGGGQAPFGTVQGAWTASATNPLTGTLSGEMVVPESASHYIRLDNPGATGRCGTRFRFRYPGDVTASASILIGRNNDGTEVGVTGLQVLPGGLFQMIRTGSGNPITESRPSASLGLVAGDKPWVSCFYAPGETATTARLGYRIYAPDGVTVLHEWAPDTDIDVGTTGSLTRYRYGSVTTAQWPSEAFVLDDIWGGDLPTGWAVPPLAPPTLNITSGTASLWLHDARGSDVGAGTGLAYTLAHTSGPDRLSGVIEPVAGLFLIPQAASSSTYTITATTTAGSDSEVVTVPAAASGSAPGSVRRRVWDGTALV